MFISTEDFKVVATEQALKAITQADPDNVENAIAEAVEEVAGYLRPRYDCKQVFAAEGERRNRQLVMYTADIALYNMVACLPQRMGSDVRQQRYDRAIEWLEQVRDGKIVPDLPPLIDSEGNATSSAGVMSYGNGPDHHTW